MVSVCMFWITRLLLVFVICINNSDWKKKNKDSWATNILLKITITWSLQTYIHSYKMTSLLDFIRQCYLFAVCTVTFDLRRKYMWFLLYNDTKPQRVNYSACYVFYLIKILVKRISSRLFTEAINILKFLKWIITTCI